MEEWQWLKIYSPALIAAAERYKRCGLNLIGIIVTPVAFILGILCQLKKNWMLSMPSPDRILSDSDLKQAGPNLD